MNNQESAWNKQNRLTLQRRLSIKHSSALTNKNNMRISMPTHRDSMATIPQFSISKDVPVRDTHQHRHSLMSNCMSLSARPAGRQAILTNLVNKLENEDELKERISSKIRTHKDFNECHHFSIFSCTSNNDDIQTKLAKCEKQLEQYKELVKKLSQSITHKAPTADGSTQTEVVSPRSDMGFDYMDNLEETLKILQTNKMS